MELQSSRDPLPEASASVAKTPKRIREGPAGSDPQGWSHRAGWAARGRTGHSLDVRGRGSVGNPHGESARFQPWRGSEPSWSLREVGGSGPEASNMWTLEKLPQSPEQVPVTEHNVPASAGARSRAGTGRSLGFPGEALLGAQVWGCWFSWAMLPTLPRGPGQYSGELPPAQPPPRWHPPPVWRDQEAHRPPSPPVSCKHVSGEHAELRTWGRASEDSAASGSDTGCQGSAPGCQGSAPTAASRARPGSPGPVQDASGDLITPLCS